MQDIPGKPIEKPFKWVGTRPVRPDGVPKVTGRAQYGSDLTMPGMLVGRVLRSPHAHARIRSLDIAKAAALPGVKAVVTCADFPEQKFEYVGPERVAVNFWHVTRNIMAREKVLYEGHAVAAVAAITDATYRQAWNWKDKDKFPARTYLPLCNALAARGKTAPASLWGMAPRAGRVADARGQE